MTADTDQVSRRARIERQRRLPFAKAVEISARAIRVRFWRSMLTISSIILAIAFLMWQLTSAEIVRRLEDVAQDRERVDRDAEGLKTIFDDLDTKAKRLEAELQPVLDAYDTATRRLAAGKALGSVPEAEERVEAARTAVGPLRERLEEEHIRKARDEYEAAQKERERIRRRLDAIGPLNPEYDDLRAQQDEVADRLARLQQGYDEYLKRRTPKDQAEGEVRDAEKRRDAVREAAEKARTEFSDVAPAPEGSDAHDRLYAEFKAAKRENDRAAKRIERAEGRAARAKERWEGATHKALVELLAAKGESSGDEREGERERRQINLGFGLQLTPTRVWIITLALMVCLVGITNAMLMSVTERYREIGTMKCLGALDSFIVKIFLLESSFMGAFGVLCGIILGFVLAFLVQVNNFGQFTTRYFPTGGILKWAGVAFVVGAVLSLLGGILPAQRAARMAPVEAMRVEE